MDTTLFWKPLVIQNPFVKKSRFCNGGAPFAVREPHQRPAGRGPAGSGPAWCNAAQTGIGNLETGFRGGKLIRPIYRQ
ncbi:hypothetical protein PUN4_780093 [Paraburkholderia unamae]|nr:hypothetical protein PUN4_780093 [Paraburkholderia unamae]